MCRSSYWCSFNSNENVIITATCPSITVCHFILRKQSLDSFLPKQSNFNLFCISATCLAKENIETCSYYQTLCSGYVQSRFFMKSRPAYGNKNNVGKLYMCKAANVAFQDCDNNFRQIVLLSDILQMQSCTLEPWYKTEQASK